MAADPSYQGDVSMFSVGTVLARSFSTFFRHPFVFLGLSILAQSPGLIVMILMRNSPARDRVAPIFNFIFGLAIQGAIAYGVYEVLRGEAARFGKSLSHGMSRVIPLVFAVLSCSMFFTLVIFGGAALAGILARGLGRFIVFPALILMFLVLIVLWCKWSVFVPACVVERLGPIESLNRSSDLTKGCRLKIAGLYLLCFVIGFVVAIVFGFFASKFNHIFLVAFQQLVLAVPMAFSNVITAVIYYALREVKEGIGIEQLANVFD